MKIFKYKNLLFLTVAMLFVSCNKDFLEKEPTGVLTKERLEENRKKGNTGIDKGSIAGLYNLTFRGGTGGTRGHSDFGHKSVDICLDLMSGDMALNERYGHFGRVYELNDMTRSDSRARVNWRYYYQIIKGVNEVINSYGDKIPEKEDDKAIFGQVKALRAYSYFYLVNLYQQPYSESKDKLSVIIHDKPGLQLKGQSTVKEVYDFIIKDLEMAITSLDKFNRTNKTQINKYVAKGLLTYAYLFTENYTKAEANANDIITNGGFRLMNNTDVLRSGFNSVSIPGWMWAIDLTTDNTPMLRTFWGMVDVFTYSYASAGHTFGMDSGLYAKIPITDVRKRQFVDAFRDGQLLPIGKFYDSGRKFQGDRAWTNDLVYMRVAEFYLAKAEAQARLGNETGAKQTLLQLVAQRDAKANERIAGLSGQALLDEIYFQTRVELWGEGKSLFAAKRFKKKLTRGANHIKMRGVSYNYNDQRMIYEIPEQERNNNPKIK